MRGRLLAIVVGAALLVTQPAWPSDTYRYSYPLNEPGIMAATVELDSLPPVVDGQVCLWLGATGRDFDPVDQIEGTWLQAGVIVGSLRPGASTAMVFVEIHRPWSDHVQLLGSYQLGTPLLVTLTRATPGWWTITVLGRRFGPVKLQHGAFTTLTAEDYHPAGAPTVGLAWTLTPIDA